MTQNREKRGRATGRRKEPHKMFDVVSELMTRRGFARVQAGEAYENAWREAAGEVAAKYSRVASLRRGVLEVVVANSTLVQELTFQKNELLQQLNHKLPEEGITHLRLRVGAIE